jgi:hypothetical protein
LHWWPADEGWVCFDAEANSSFLLPPLARWICEQGGENADEQGLWQRLQAETGEAEADCREAVRECMEPLRESGLIAIAGTALPC